MYKIAQEETLKTYSPFHETMVGHIGGFLAGIMFFCQKSASSHEWTNHAPESVRVNRPKALFILTIFLATCDC